MQNKKTTHFLSSPENSYNIMRLKMGTVLIIPHAFMPRKFIDVEKNP